MFRKENFYLNSKAKKIKKDKERRVLYIMINQKISFFTIEY
jgi:hypothetical protein